MTVDIGQVAPDFTLPDQNKQPITLSDFRGRTNVVLIFYPYAFTNVCQGELCSVQEDLSSFANEDVQVLTVSIDTPFAHRVWAEQQGYSFPLLADFWPHGAVAQAYGVFDEAKGCAIRGTFVIDTAGVVRWKVVNAIPDARDQDEYLKALASL
jgi:peroxiredoxin